MKYIFELNHPKHYFQFKFIMQNLQKDGHQILVLARDKDVLLKVLDEEKVSYKYLGNHHKKMWAKMLGGIPILLNYYRIVQNFHPDVLISKASPFGVIIGRLIHKKTIIFVDSEIVKLNNKFVIPLCTKVVTPENFTLDYGKKHIRVKGVFENCYLAPSVFTPDRSVAEKYHLSKPYAILRFVGWYANHDVKNSGFSIGEKIQMVKTVKPYMTVYISSEKELPAELVKYKLPTPASQIHSVLSLADLYLGDSQTMATEAALLGTPAIRSNSFVGEHDMSNFKMLEEKYGLLRNVAEFKDVLTLLEDWSCSSRKAEWKKKQEDYFESVGDSNSEIVRILTDI